MFTSANVKIDRYYRRDRQEDTNIERYKILAQRVQDDDEKRSMLTMNNIDHINAKNENGMTKKQISQQNARGGLSSKMCLISHLDIRQSAIFVLEENVSLV